MRAEERAEALRQRARELDTRQRGTGNVCDYDPGCNFCQRRRDMILAALRLTDTEAFQRGVRAAKEVAEARPARWRDDPFLPQPLRDQRIDEAESIAREIAELEKVDGK